MQVAKDVQGTTLAKFIRKHANAGAEIHTDEFSGYFWLDGSEYKHKSVKHADEYVTAEGVTTNGVENVWSLYQARHHRPVSQSLCQVSAALLG